ncbi:hypothetical protein CCR75_002923 [Bremia lactucae]|uniref:AAA+ ATPase domain-containing protein n=1 Tax=Bremia lactucae TaxID=4779 RepID=A0A976IGL5_BRELC|nr:hypothetical protein CCR75_002923 [Bremia lactucae]
MEAKVSFHVRRYLRECEERGAHPSEATITSHLLDSYAEYQRKPQGALRRVVAKVLKKAQPDTPKRSRSQSDTDDEMQIQLLEQQNCGGNSLNRSMQQKYADQNADKPASKKGKIVRRRVKTNDLIENTSDESRGFVVERPSTRYCDIGGIQAILQEVRELIEYPLTHPEVYAHLGVEPPRGVLLHGPPGTGKSMLAHAIAGECGATFLRISAPEIVSGMSGESEQKLRELFDEAISRAPSIIFIDEIDAITPKRESSARGMEKRIVAQLLTSTDSLNLDNTGGKPVILIGATNRPDALDSALRRAGRFDREICLGIPDEAARETILRVLARNMTLEGEFDFTRLARKTPGYVGADLVSLTKEAAVGAVNRIFTNIDAVKDSSTRKEKKDAECLDTELFQSIEETPKEALGVVAMPSAADDLRARVEPFTEAQLALLSIRMTDFEAAIPKVQPSSKREGFATIPDITWDDIGALKEVRDELSLAVLQPIAHPERFAALGLSMPTGVLLYGPPGCGKTLLAKAIAHESGANFISIKGPELLDKYVGESERSVRQVFQRARASSPCVIFFDELDALAPRRSGGGNGETSGNGVSERVVNQLLTEMDGLESRRNVFVMAATNRPDIIDSAMLRPGRLDKLLYVPLPQAFERYQILKTISAKCAIAASVQLETIAADPRCEGFSGADLSALIREAGMTALRETDFSTIETQTTRFEIQHHHFLSAFDRVFPSVSRADQRLFDRMKKNLRKSRLAIPKVANGAIEAVSEANNAISN